MLRRLVRMAGVGALVTALAGVALLGLAFAISRGLGRETLRAAAEAEAESQLGVPVHISAIEGPLLPELRLVGVRIGSDEGASASAERITLHIDVSTLWSEAPWTLDVLHVEGLAVVGVEAPNGQWQLPFASESDEPTTASAPAPELWIREAALEHSRLELRRSDGQRLVLRAGVGTQDFRLPLTAANAREMRGELSLTVDSEAFADIAVTKAELTAKWGSGELNATGAVAAVPSGTLEFEATTDIGDWLDDSVVATAELELQVADLDLAGWSGNPELSGNLAGRSHLQVRRAAGAAMADTTATIDVSLADSSRAVIESLELAADAGSDRWILSRCEVRGAGVQLSARGEGDRDSVEHFRIEARADDLQTLAGLVTPPGTRGQLALDLEVSGPFAQPLGRASLRGEQLVTGGVVVGSLQAELVGSGDGRVTVESFEVSGGTVPLRLREPAVAAWRDGALALERWVVVSGAQSIDHSIAIDGVIGDSYVRDLKLDLRGLDIAPVGVWAGSSLPLSGSADGQLRVDGEFPFPSLDGQLTWTRPGIGGVEFDELSASFETVDDRLRIRGRVRDQGRDPISAEGWVPYRLEPGDWLGSPQTALNLRVDRFDLSRVGAIDPGAIEQLGGRVDIEVDLVGGPTPRATGRVELFDASVRFPGVDHTFSPIAGTARFEPAAAGIRIDSLTLDIGQQRLAGHGVIGAHGFHDVNLTARDVDVAQVALWYSAAQAWRGVVDLDVTASGDFARPQTQIVAAWREPEIAGRALERVDARLGLDGRVARLDLHALEGGREILRAEASAPYGSDSAGADDWLRMPQTRLDVRAQGLPLEWVQPLLSRQVRDVSGRVDATAEIRGGVDPVVRGSIELADGRVVVPLLRQSFEPIQARISVTGESVAIEEFRVGAPGAGGTLSGSVQLANLVPDQVELQLTLDDLPVASSRALETRASGGIRVTGPVSQLDASGQIELHDLAIALGDEADTSMREIRIRTRDGVAMDGSGVVERGPGPPGAYERAALDIRLEVPRNSWLRGSGAELDLTGELALRKQPMQPAAVVGSAEIVRGSYYFQQKRFEVRRGSATFDGGTTIDPLLDVVAAHRVRDVTILIFVTGRASAPKLRIGSEPALSQSDALAYLLLGRPANQIGAGNQAGMESAAAALATGIAAAQIGQMLAEALPIDSVDVTIDESGKPADIKVGKYITDRVFVRYGRTLGAEPEDQVGVELRINDNWSVGTDVSTDDSAGADLIWSLDY